MNDVLEAVLADLAAEGEEIESWVAGLSDAEWRQQTPAVGWDIATTIAHLAWTDEVAVLAAGAVTESGKEAWDAVVLEAISDPTGYVDACALEIGKLPADELLARWQRARPALGEALRAFPDGQKMPWFGPPMSPASMATARLMESWAHGIDIADTLNIAVEPTDRIKNVAHLGVRTRNFAFANNGLEPPTEEFRVELDAPSGAVWSWGPEDAAQSVKGSAYAFCLLVTQRRHRHDLDLVAVGPDAETWLEIAQAFAGPSGEGRVPRGSDA
ncbi:MAG: TIGR03084 family metal-binding protein [Marmoricola sp.]